MQTLELGKILRPHGVRGVMKAEDWCGDELFAAWPEKITLAGREYKTLSVSRAGRSLLLSVEGINSVEQAETLRGAVITCRREDVTLPEGKILFSDAYGFSVFDKRLQKTIGVLQGTEENAVQVLLRVESAGGVSLIPAINPFLLDIDVNTQTVTVSTIEGMLFDED